MRNPTIQFITLLFLLCASCNRKGSDLPTPIPTTNDTLRHTVVVAKPDTTIYIGTYTETIWAYDPPMTMYMGSSAHNNFIFKVASIDSNHFFIWNESPAYMAGTECGIIDTFVNNTLNYYLSDPRRLRGNSKAMEIGVDTLNLGGEMNFGWAYRRPICGDNEYRYCHFRGVKQ